jgi:uncharacterized LabA/DUF88 family protein
MTLAREQELWCSRTYYYTAPPYQSPKPTEDEIERRRKYDKFVSKLKSIPNFFVREGRCQKGDDDFHQKGVDTLLVMDLMDTILQRNIKSILLLTSDTDFVPLLNKIRNDYKIRVILYYFSDYIRNSKFSMSNHLLTACDNHFLVKKEHIESNKIQK